MSDRGIQDEWPRLDKSKLRIGRFDDPDDDVEYWLSRTPAERMRTLEYLRRVAYGPAATSRLQRVLEIAQSGAD